MYPLQLLQSLLMIKFTLIKIYVYIIIIDYICIQLIRKNGITKFRYNDFFSEQVLKYTFFCNDSGIDSLFVFYIFFFLLS